MARGTLTCITVVGCEGQHLHGISLSRQAAAERRAEADGPPRFVPVGALVPGASPQAQRMKPSGFANKPYDASLLFGGRSGGD